MADYQLQSSRFYKKATFSGTGVLAPSTGHKLYGESYLAVTIENVDASNVIQVQGKLSGAADWQTIDSLSGSGRFINIDISNSDFIRFNVSSYSSSSGIPTIIASGFYRSNRDTILTKSESLVLNATDVVQGTESSSIDIQLLKGYSYQSQWTDTTPSAINFVDGDVTVGTDTIAETSHGFLTGLKGRFTTTGTLPAGLATLTDYFVIKVDDNNFKVASSLANANANTPVDITAASGGGTHTFTPSSLSATLKLQGSLDDINWDDISNSSVIINSTSSFLHNVTSAFYKYVRIAITQTAGELSVTSNFMGKA